MKITQRLLAISPALTSAAIVSISIFFYSWRSTFVNLQCSIQDDSFYYFIPGWNAAHGAGFTFGGEKTSGFQPLYELLLTVFALFCNSLESLVRTALAFNGWLFAGTSLVIAFCVRALIKSEMRDLRRPAVILSVNVAALSFLSLHTVFFSSVTGKENALAALLLAAILCAVLSAGRTRSKALWVGSLCGLLLLTRIAPSSLLYSAIAIAFVPGWKQRLYAIAACLTPWLAWGVFANFYFGHVLPMSMLVKASTPNHLSAVQAIQSGLQYFWESAKFSVSAHSRFNLLQVKARGGLHSLPQVLLMTSAVVLACIALLHKLFRQPWSRAMPQFPKALLALFAFDLCGIFCNVLFGAVQAGRADDMYYTVWYVYDLPVLIAVNCGFVAAWLQTELSSKQLKWAAAAALALAAFFVADIAWYQRLKPYGISEDAKFAGSWQVKKFESADWFRRHVNPANPNYRVASYSAGALAFYLFDHVVNLDGLANNAAGEALMASQSTAEYIRRARPDYLIDTCRTEKDLGNLERLHTVPFAEEDGYCIDRFVAGGALK